jgi:galactokinase
VTRLFVPGRIEVLGKHTDYAGGRSLLAAVDRGFTVVVEPTDDHQITVHDTGRHETVTLAVPEAEPDVQEPIWAVYPRTVIRRAAPDFPGRLRGCRIELESTLPSAAGLSTSSALITAIFLALDAVCGLSDSEPALASSREALAGYLGAVERGSPYPRQKGAGDERGGDAGVGTRGGSEDHVGILCAESGALVRYAFEPVRPEGVVPVPAGYVFAVAASGVVAAKTGGARSRYNRLSDLATRVAEAWRTATGEGHRHMGAIVAAVGPDRFLEVIAAGEGDGGRGLERRARHFVAESTEIIPAATDALAAGDLERFGDVVDRSQALAEELLGNQVPETVHLARFARELGAVAASAFGAGFGGSVWALVPAPDADDFLAAWRDRYLAAFPARAAASFFTTPAAGPARTLR